jgi:hypothetical protein
MGLIATIGAVSANSYVTVAEADAYFEDRVFASEWEDMENQEAVLVTASRQLDWYAKWKGVKASTTQAMGWPRADVIMPDGSYEDPMIIPQAVKTAVFELALSSFEGDRTADSAMAGLAEVKVGSLDLKADDGLYNTKPKTIPIKIWNILTGYTLRSGNSQVWLLRA